MPIFSHRYYISFPFFYGWMIVGIAALANICRVSSAVEILSIFIPHFIAEFQWDRTLISSAVSLGGLTGAAVAPFAGRLVDRHGPGVVIAVGSILVGIGCLSVGIFPGAIMFILGFGLMRLAGQGVVMTASPVAVANWFIKDRGRAMALMYTFSYAGIIIAPPIVQWLINTGGWRTGWISLAILTLIGGVLPPLLLMVRRPEEVRLLPYGKSNSPQQTDNKPSLSVTEMTREWSTNEAFKTSAVWLIMGSTLLSSVMISGIGLFQVPFYLERGISPTISAIVISTFAIGLTIGSTTFGWLTDRWLSTKKLIIISHLGLVGLIIMLLQVQNALMAFAFAFWFGILIGGLFTMTPLMLANYYGRIALGSIIGVVQVAKVGGLAVGPLLIGAFWDLTQRYEGAFLIFAILSGIAALLMFFSHPPKMTTIKSFLE